MNLLNIQNINSNKMSLAKVLLIFYVIIASNFTNGLMAKQMREYIESNRLVQHIIGLILMIILVTTVGGVVDTYQAILYSVIGYIWFIFTTKLDIHWNIIIIVLLFIGYMYENSLEVKEEQIKSDPNVSEEIKEKIIQSDESTTKYIVSTVMLITIIGTILYSHKKHVQYGGGYNLFTYLLY
jgi:small-conductance mechanosensitive channel